MAEQTQFVIFKLGSESYGVDVSKVAAITEASAVVRVPDTPDYVLGIMNLRGSALPLIDLQKKFHGTEADDLKRHGAQSLHVLVLQVREHVFGFAVENTNRVLWLDHEDIEEIPVLLGGEGKKFLKGIGKQDGQLYILLDADYLLTEGEQEKMLALCDAH